MGVKLKLFNIEIYGKIERCSFKLNFLCSVSFALLDMLF